jgi:hypothetical protein
VRPVRTLLVALLAAALGFVAVPVAAASTYHARSGSVSATLSWQQSRDRPRATLTILRAGQVRLHGRLRLARTCGPGCTAIAGNGYKPLRVLDLDGDSAPEVLISYFSGGAHCCVLAKLFNLGADGRYRSWGYDFADAGFALRRLRGRPGRVFFTGDARFAYAFADFAESGFPFRVERYDGRRFVNVTRSLPRRLRRDAAFWWRQYRAALRHAGRQQLGYLAAWAADQYNLQRKRYANRILRRELALGHLARRGPFSFGPHNAAFIRALHRMLARLGYAR